MIILDEVPPSKLSSYSDVAGPTLRFPDRVAGRSTTSLSLPDYETSQALANNHFVYKKAVRRKVDARLWRATPYALIIYIALSVVIGIPILVIRLKHHQHRSPPPPRPPPPPPWGSDLSELNGPILLDNLIGSTTLCNSWTSTSSSGKTFVASSKYNASHNGDFSIRSNVTDDGLQSIYGGLMIGMNPDQEIKDAVLSVTMQASSTEISGATNVCFSKIDNACDLVLFVPDHLSDSDFLRFNITLLFPYSTTPYTVDKLATWLPMFTQVFGEMDKQLTFNDATIEGSSSSFDAGYIQANNLLVKTALAEIKGKFQVNQSLTLDTIEAPINADITLVNDWTRHAPTYLTLDTGNGNINTQIHLLAPRPLHEHHTVFFTSIKTFNASLKVSVTHDNSTPPSEFHLRAQNNLAESQISVDQKYQGTFDLQTKLASASVQPQNVTHLVDPLGENRQRHYQYDYMSATRIFGWVGWGQRPAATHYHQGHVELASSHSPVVLQLDGAGTHDQQS